MVHVSGDRIWWCAQKSMHFGGVLVLFFFLRFFHWAKRNVIVGTRVSFAHQTCNVGFCAAKITNYKVASYLWLLLLFLYYSVILT